MDPSWSSPPGPRHILSAQDLTGRVGLPSMSYLCHSESRVTWAKGVSAAPHLSLAVAASEDRSLSLPGWLTPLSLSGALSAPATGGHCACHRAVLRSRSGREPDPAAALVSGCHNPLEQNDAAPSVSLCPSPHPVQGGPCSSSASLLNPHALTAGLWQLVPYHGPVTCCWHRLAECHVGAGIDKEGAQSQQAGMLAWTSRTS